MNDELETLHLAREAFNAPVSLTTQKAENVRASFPVMAEGGVIEKALKLTQKFGSSPRDTVKSIKRHRGRSANS